MTMGAQENAKLIRGGYDAFNRADIAALTELFAEGTMWHVPGRSVMAGDYKGRDATFEYFGRLHQSTDGTVRANLRSLVAEGDTVVARQTNTATRGDRHLNLDVCLVFEMRDGRIVEGQEYHYDQYAWDEFWS
jgi:ketosteroid isomerase-like protein